MAQKISKSAGWRFQARKGSGLIIYTGGSNDSFDRQTLNHLTEQIQDIEGDDLAVFMKVVPPIDQLIQQIPFSLPLIEAIYQKCEAWNCEEDSIFPYRQLQCEQLFCQLVWWSAYCEQNNHNAILNKRIPTFQELEQCVSTVIGILARNCHGLVERAQADRQQLSSCLESLGCHGLVNCSSGLIRMCDAVALESTRHAEKIKSVASRVKDLSDTKHHHGSVDPSSASHQRQMSLRLSEVFERLKLNETLEASLEDVLSNPHLTSLLRIVRKRVASDRLLIGLFNAFTRAAPDDFSFEQLDPVVAKLIVVFNNAYEKLLNLAPAAESDSGCSADSSTTEGRSSHSAHLHSPDRMVSRQSVFESSQAEDSLEKERDRPRSKSSHPIRRYRNNNRTSTHHSSLKDLTSDDQYSLKPSKSLGHIPVPSPRSTTSSEMRRSYVAHKEDPDDTMKMRLHINHLKKELSNAQQQISQLINIQSRPGSAGLWPEPDYPDATSYYNCSSRDDVIATLERFSGLFVRAKQEVLPVLDDLPEFHGSEELQLKTILSGIVLTYRSVVDSVHRRRERIWDVIQEGEPRQETEDNMALDVALFRHMYRRAKSQYGMKNAKEVTSQIWKTLYDFPSLKTCTAFNRYILECCDVAWDLVAGIDGRFPRLRLEYEGQVFDEHKHRRSEECYSNGDVIRQFYWPGLFDNNTDKCLLKAIVMTN